MLDKIDFDIDTKVMKDIDDDIRLFNINLNKVDNIKIPNLDKIVKRTIKKVKKDKNELNKVIIMNILILFILIGSTVSLYNPALVYKIPPAYKFFNNINQSLNIDFIVNLLGFDKFVPKIELDESGKLQIIDDPSMIKESEVKSPTNAKESLDLIHSMANLIVVADHKWGSTDITPKTIDIALDSLYLIKDDYKRTYLRTNLEKWKNGDFSNGIDLHNYVWDMLDGSIGIADSLDQQMIDNIISKHFTKKD